MVNVGKYTIHGSYGMESESDGLNLRFSFSKRVFSGSNCHETHQVTYPLEKLTAKEPKVMEVLLQMVFPFHF